MISSTKFYKKVIEKNCKRMTEVEVFNIAERMYHSEFSQKLQLVYDMHFVKCEPYCSIEKKLNISRSGVTYYINKIVNLVRESVNLQFCDIDDNIEMLIGKSNFRGSHTKSYIGKTVKDIISMYESDNYIFKNVADESIALILIKRFPCAIPMHTMYYLVGDYDIIRWYVRLYNRDHIEKCNGMSDYPYKFVKNFYKAVAACNIALPSSVDILRKMTEFEFVNLIEHYDELYTSDYYNNSDNILELPSKMITIVLPEYVQTAIEREFGKSNATIKNFIRLAIDQRFNPTMGADGMRIINNTLSDISNKCNIIHNESVAYQKTVEEFLQSVN